jgi:hypothetical protein
LNIGVDERNDVPDSVLPVEELFDVVEGLHQQWMV